MRVLVLGDCADRTWVTAALSELNVRLGPISILLHGNSTRVDRWACRWAERAGIPCAEVCHRTSLVTGGWLDLIVAFPGSPASLLRKASVAGVPVQLA